MNTFSLSGRIADGTGRPIREGVVVVRGDVITEVRSERPGDEAALRLPASAILAPGFIDIHSHADHFLLIDPSAASKVMQGVTTDVIGNCGYSAAPLTDAMRFKRARGLDRYGLSPSWSGMREYLEELERARPAVNVAALAGHGTIRAAAEIPEGRAANKEERVRLRRITEEILEDGAFGVTTGLFYAPGLAADRAEILTLLEPVAAAHRLYAAHIRDERDRVIEALEEALDLAERSGARFQYSHVKAWGRRNWRFGRKILGLLRLARMRGLDLGTDLYPYTSAATELLAGIGCSGEKEMAVVTRRVESLIAEDPLWPKRVRILTSGLREARGRTLASWPDPVAAAVRIIEHDPRTSAAFDELSEGNLKAFLALDCSSIGSDASNRNVIGPLAKERPHPRAFGTFPRVLARYAGVGRTISTEEAIRRMTSLPASRLRLEDRGRIAVGMKADLVVFDEATIEDTATFTSPRSFPRGLLHVWVNGVATVTDGVLTERRGGGVLRARR